jgi:methionyl-tRNA formyltransferase
VSTFKQILRKNVLSLPPLGVVNIHPSLLPRYRGPCPTNAALLNDEKVTGVTFHYVTEELDEGDILLQKSIPISETDNDGVLRQKLANLAGSLIPDIVAMFDGFTKPVGMPQDHNFTSFAPKPKLEDGYLEMDIDTDTIRRKMRAYNPLPGTSLMIGDRRVPVNRYEFFQDNRPDSLYECNDVIELFIGSQAIRLYKNL